MHAHTQAGRQAQTHLKARRPPVLLPTPTVGSSMPAEQASTRNVGATGRALRGAAQVMPSSPSSRPSARLLCLIAQLLLGYAAKASARAQQEQGALARAHAHGAVRELTRQGPVRRRQVLGASPDPQDLRASTPDAILA